MVVFPNAKINIGLQISEKRSDGYHNIETIFYPIHLWDSLEIIENRESNIVFSFTSSGTTLKIADEANLCVRAYSLLKSRFPQIRSLQMHLLKGIPAGAGLGGGSSDAASALSLLNTFFSLNLSPSQLLGLALELGSDCPFFIINKPCYATGRGEILNEISVDLSEYKILIINPGLEISTASAFSWLTRTAHRINLREAIREPVSEWKHHIHNDFEPVVFERFPQLLKIRNNLYNSGAVYASMSGTGSTVYGIFEKSADADPEMPSEYFSKWV